MPTEESELLAADKDATKRLSRLRATAVRFDSKPGLLAVARRLRRRLPGDEHFGDALSTADAGTLGVVAKQVSALGPERGSLTQEVSLAGLQLWQSLSEAAGRGRGDAELAVLFTDLVGFSTWALKAGDGPTLELLRAVGTAEETAVNQHRGQIVKRLGDGLMATFLDPQDAVDAALDANEALDAVEVEGYTPRMRAGIHWGRPRKLGGDYLGVDVNIAARVADAAKAGEVLISDSALARIETSELRTGRPKRLRAEGVPRQLHTFRVSRA
jgi:adenylate cyclase